MLYHHWFPPWNYVWGDSAEIPCQRRYTSQIWVVLLIGWSKFSTNKHYPDLGIDPSSEFLASGCYDSSFWIPFRALNKLRDRKQGFWALATKEKSMICCQSVKMSSPCIPFPILFQNLVTVRLNIATFDVLGSLVWHCQDTVSVNSQLICQVIY